MPADSLAAWLRDNHVPVTIMRPGGTYRFVVTEKAQKKRMLLSGRCMLVGDDHVMELAVGTRPFIGGWLDEAFGAGAARRATAETTGLG